MKTIALIPARGGSKGIPGKNIARILNKPLIAYSIEAALGCSSIEGIWVSSDSEEILSVAREYENLHIHEREKDLASDSSPITDTIAQIFQLNPSAEALILLQPTSPLRTSNQIAEAIELLNKNSLANSVISVCSMDDVHPARMYWMDNENEAMRSILPEYETTRRQEIPLAYYRNGSIYVVRRKAFETSGKIMISPSLGYVMPSSQLLNIDEPRDLIIAEPLMKAWQEGKL